MGRFLLASTVVMASASGVASASMDFFERGTTSQLSFTDFSGFSDAALTGSTTDWLSGNAGDKVGITTNFPAGCTHESVSADGTYAQLSDIATSLDSIHSTLTMLQSANEIARGRCETKATYSARRMQGRSWNILTFHDNSRYFTLDDKPASGAHESLLASSTHEKFANAA